MDKSQFSAQKLTYARIARGMTMKKLSELANISRQMISNYEAGKTTPKGSNLLKLADVLNFPPSFFGNYTQPLNPGAEFFRSQSATSKRLRDMQKVRLLFARNIFDTLSVYVKFPKINLPASLDIDFDQISNNTIASKAKELRTLWGFDNVIPIPNLVKVAEANGIIIAKANMKDSKLDAVSKWIVDRPFILLTDNGESSVRRRFNVAHEIGHLLLHSSVESIYDLTSKEMKLLEKQANMFASYFLLPNKAFMDTLMTTSIEGYVDLKRYWKVSIQAMIYKTRFLELITDDQYLYLSKKIAWNKWKKSEPLDNTIPMEEPALFSTVYKMITDHGLMTNQGLKATLSLPDDELSKMVGEIVLKHSSIGMNQPKLKLL